LPPLSPCSTYQVLPVRIAGGNELQILGKENTVHDAIANNIFEQGHAVARVDFVEEDIKIPPGLSNGLSHGSLHPLQNVLVVDTPVNIQNEERDVNEFA
jgi:hypothetical protein